MPFRSKINIMISLLALSVLGVGCDSKKAPSAPPPPVTVSKPMMMPVSSYLIETGNTVASSSIDLVARVAGYLDSNNFRDGSLVKKGDLLFVIQPQPYADQVIQAQAALDSDTAVYTYDKAEYERQVSMYKKQATSLANVQQWLATRDQAAAAVEGAKANLNNAQINYSYTHVLAPEDGRIGRHLVDTGNLVGNGSATKLATLQQIDPMYVYFTINELDLLKIRQAAKKMDFNFSDIQQVPIEVALQDEEGFPHKGYLDFAATELDASTGTIQMRGILPNKDDVLLPGLYVQIRITLDKPTSQLVIPQVAVMNDQAGTYVFTLNGDKVVQTRVKTGAVENGMIVITKGLDEEDRVIVSGIQNATPGGTVTPTEKM